MYLFLYSKSFIIDFLIHSDDANADRTSNNSSNLFLKYFSSSCPNSTRHVISSYTFFSNSAPRLRFSYSFSAPAFTFLILFVLFLAFVVCRFVRFCRRRDLIKIYSLSAQLSVYLSFFSSVNSLIWI